MPETLVFIPVIQNIPGPWGWISALLFATFVLHLVLMNAVVGVAIIAAFHALRGAAGEGQRLAYPLPKGVALVVNLGVAPLLFLQALYGAFVYSSSIIIAFWWLSIMMVVMLAYYGLYVYTTPSAFGVKSRNVALVISILLLLFTAFVQVNNVTLMQNPALWTAYAKNSGGTLFNIADAQLWPRFLHVILACLAVGGLCIAVPARLKLRFLARSNAMLQQQQPYFDRMRSGLHWFFYATLLQIPVGAWFSFTLLPQQQKLYMGGDVLATSLYGLAAVCMVVSLVAAKKSRAVLAAVMVGIVIICMAGLRSLVRVSLLEPLYKPLINPDVGGPVWLFLGSLVFTLGIVIWMLRIFRKSPNHAPQTPKGV